MNRQHTIQYGQQVAHLTSLLCLCTCALFMAGCAQPQSQTAADRVYVPNVNETQVMTIAEDVLAGMHFTIEKADVPSGVIRTRPLSGAQFFELWRSDNVGPDNGLQANLHTLRRTAELQISRQGAGLSIGCVVRVQRLSVPERELASNARGYEMFSRSSSLVQKIQLYPEQQKDMVWIELHDDMPLAKEILGRVEARIVSQTGNQPQAAGDRT